MPTVQETDQAPLRHIDKQYSILIVGDMANDRQLIITTLSNSGYRTFEVNNDGEALRHLNDQIIDAVLLAIARPGINNFDVCRKIRQMREMQVIPEVPVIMLIPNKEVDVTINEGLNAGATDFIIKPFDSDELRARMAVVKERIRLNEQRAACFTAESTLRSQAALLAMVTQEIRTPMNALIGLSYLGLQARLDKTPRSYLEKINFSARSLLSIINDALDFSRIEGGRLRLSEENFNVREYLTQVHDLANGLACDKGVGFKLDVSPGVPEVLCGDAARLGQALVNLVNTAVKLTDKGVVTLHVRADVSDADFVELLFIIRGRGIDPRRIECLSEWRDCTNQARHYRHSNSTLNLAISRELISMMGGRIWVEHSSEENGCFHCSVRLKSGYQMTNAKLLPIESLDSAKARVQGARILIVEENPTDQLVIRDLLELAGAVVDIAGKDQSAMDRLVKEKFDVVIVNPQGSVLNDAESVGRLREKSKYARLCIIGIIDPLIPEECDRSVVADMDDYLPWPIDPELTYRILAKWLTDKSETAADQHLESAQSSKPLPVDISVLHRMFHNNATLVRKFGLKFVEVANDTLAEMNVAQAEKDLPALGRLGHKLKSSARTIGASSFADLCEKLEKANLNNNWSNAESLLKQIPVVLTQITQQLEQEFRIMDK
ncbi:MAG: response regulator [Nitrosomonas sp.]